LFSNISHLLVLIGGEFGADGTAAIAPTPSYPVPAARTNGPRLPCRGFAPPRPPGAWTGTTNASLFGTFASGLIPKFASKAYRACLRPSRWGRRTMPSLLRLLTIIVLLCAVIYGGLYALAHFVQPKSREISVSIPPDKFFKEH
jgi:hypothetical protein